MKRVITLLISIVVGIVASCIIVNATVYNYGVTTGGTVSLKFYIDNTGASENFYKSMSLKVECTNIADNHEDSNIALTANSDVDGAKVSIENGVVSFKFESLAGVDLGHMDSFLTLNVCRGACCNQPKIKYWIDGDFVDILGTDCSEKDIIRTSLDVPQTATHPMTAQMDVEQIFSTTSPNETELCNHKWDKGVITTQPTCVDGIRTFTCTLCGDKLYEVEWAMPFGHNWDNGKVTKEATCAENGVKTYTCARCGETRTEEILKTTHTHTAQTKEGTYFSSSVKKEKCKLCGAVIKTISYDKKVLKTPKVVVKGSKKAIKVTYKKVKDAKGFAVTYKIGKKKAVTKKFTLSKKELKKSSVTKTIKLTKKGSYKVTVKAFVTSGKKIAYSKATKPKTVKVKIK